MVNRIFGQSYFVFVRVGLLRVVVGLSCCLAIGPWRLRGSGVGLYERVGALFVERTSRADGSNYTTINRRGQRSSKTRVRTTWPQKGTTGTFRRHGSLLLLHKRQSHAGAKLQTTYLYEQGINP